jgi:hypothetical protein
VKKLGIALAILLLALMAWSLFFDGHGMHLVIDGQEVTGPFKGLVGAGGLLVALVALFCAAIVLAFVFAGIGMVVIGLVVLAGLVVAAISLPFLLFLLVPLAIVWGFVALIRPRPHA